MYRKKEASKFSFAINPSIPELMMRDIAQFGKDLDRAWLATNPSLPKELFDQLARSKDPVIRNHARINKRWGKAGNKPVNRK